MKDRNREEAVLIRRERAVCEASVPVGGRTVHYRLTYESSAYLLRLQEGERTCTLTLGERLSAAARVFELFVQGGVTVLTAREILEDLYEQEML